MTLSEVPDKYLGAILDCVNKQYDKYNKLCDTIWRALHKHTGTIIYEEKRLPHTQEL